MKHTKLALVFLATTLLSTGSEAQELNRLDLDNGGDILWFLNAPFVGAPVSDFDPTGDLYWKVFPADAIRRTSGTAPLVGIELYNADTDPFSTQVLWAYSVTTGSAGTDGTILPNSSGPGVFVPGFSTTSTIFPVGGCAKPGYLTGWTYDEVFVDTATGMPGSLIDLTADGSTDWVFTHYFPAPGLADQNLTSGPFNSCGTTGDVTLQWFGSTDGFGAGNAGENQPDWTGLGNSIYGGFSIGGAGAFAPIPDGIDDAADLSFYFDEPTLNTYVDTANGDGYGLDPGLAGLRFAPRPVGLPGPAKVSSMGLRIYDASAIDAPAGKFAFAYANIRESLLESTGSGMPFLGGVLGLNPHDPIFLLTHFAYGRGPLVPFEDEAWFTSNQIPLDDEDVRLALIGQTLEIQGFTMEPGGNAEGTNVFTMHFHGIDGL